MGCKSEVWSDVLLWLKTALTDVAKRPKTEAQSVAKVSRPNRSAACETWESTWKSESGQRCQRSRQLR